MVGVCAELLGLHYQSSRLTIDGYLSAVLRVTQSGESGQGPWIRSFVWPRLFIAQLSAPKFIWPSSHKLHIHSPTQQRQMLVAKVKHKFSVFIEVLRSLAPNSESRKVRRAAPMTGSSKCLSKHAIHYSRINEDILAAVECGSAHLMKIGCSSFWVRTFPAFPAASCSLKNCSGQNPKLLFPLKSKTASHFSSTKTRGDREVFPHQRLSLSPFVECFLKARTCWYTERNCYQCAWNNN